MVWLVSPARRDNLRYFVATRPPLVLFTGTILLISLCLLCLSVYIEVCDVRNRDVRQDWNSLLESFSRLEFCLHGNVSSTSPAKPRTDFLTRKEAVNTFSVRTNVHVRWASHPDPYAGSNLVGIVNGRQLGSRGSEYESHVEVTFHLPNVAHLLSQCQQNEEYHEGGLACREVTLPMCVTFHSVSSDLVLPESPGKANCGPAIFLRKPRATYDMYWNMVQSPFHAFPCRNDLFVRADHVLDPTLTLMLSQADKARIRSNLHQCVLCMIFFAFLVFMYAYWRGAPPPPVYHRQVSDKRTLCTSSS